MDSVALDKLEETVLRLWVRGRDVQDECVTRKHLQEAHYVALVEFVCKIYRRFPTVIPHLNVSARVYEQSHDTEMSITCRQV